MIEIIGVRFKANGKVYYFSPGDHQFQTGDLVVVETSKGTECGEITIPNKTIQQAAVVQPLKQILRPVNKEDRKTLEQNRKKEIRAFHICEEKIAMRKLEMKLIEVECAFDNSKLLFYFTAENRVDFRDLVKDLAALNCVKSACETRQKFSAVLAFADGNFAAKAFCANSSRFPLKWQRNRDFPSTQQKFQAAAAD